MSYTPTTLAQQISALVASNLAGAASPGPWPALQNGIVSPIPIQAVADGMIAGLSGIQQCQQLGLHTDSTSSGSYSDISSSTELFIPSVTRRYFVLALADIYFSPVGTGGIRLTMDGTIMASRLIDGTALAGQYIPALIFDTILMTSGVQHSLKLQWNVASGTANTQVGISQIFWLII